MSHTENHGPQYRDCRITGPHCSLCGSVDLEDIEYGADEGYSACCNEPVTSGPCGDQHPTTERN